MDNEENRICRLCLNTCNANFEAIQDMNKEMLEIFHVNMDFDISDNCVKCKKCKDMIQKCFEFKSICLHTEDKLMVFIESRNITRATMTQVYLEDMHSKKMDHFDTAEICRFCMKPTTTYFDLDETVEYFRDMLQNFLPEVTLYFTNNPVSCSNCLDILKSCFIFLKYLHIVEEHIKAYYETEVKSGKVELNNIVQPVLKKILTEKIFIEEQLIEVYFSGLITKNCIKDQSKTRMVPLEKTTKEISNSENYCLESSEKEDSIQNYIKSEEIEIKSDGTLESDDDSEDDRNEEDAHGIRLSCHRCHYETCHEDRLKKHQALHGGNGKYECPQCHKVYSSKQSVENHFLKNHENLCDIVTSKIYYCNKCSFKTKTKHNLLVHINAIHSRLEKCQCNYCLHTGFRKVPLKPHINIAVNLNLRPLICRDCKKTFSIKSELYNHIVSCHPENADLMKTVICKIYDCAHCTYRCVTKMHITSHMEIHKKM